MGSSKNIHGCVTLVMFAGLFLFLSIAHATETKIVVRAMAKDAMFIGTSMGGAKIIIRKVESGTILAQGITKGGTGNPVTLMQEPRKRGTPLSDASTAKFEASLDLSEPTLVSVEALAPYSQRQALIKVSTQLWLLPGRDINGDGIILEIPGFVVNILYPQSSERLRLSDTKVISLTANVVMMCGCPITPEGTWDANRYEIYGIVKHNGIIIGNVPLAYADKPNTFKGSLEIEKSGVYEVQVYAYDAQTGNAGIDRVAFKVQG